MRGGDLIRLTSDHSLVGELVARGKLTEEQAEAHPQRSVITRALGPEPNVQVDVDVFPARAGDVFLLCSDGLTSMVRETKLKPILQGAESLEQAGRALIAAANEAGGRDNITVILFRLEEVGGAHGRRRRARRGAATPPSTRRSPARRSAARARARAAVSAAPATRSRPSTGAPARSRCRRSARARRPRPRRPRRRPAPRPLPQTAKPERRRRRRRISAGPLLALMLAVCVLGGLWLATRAVYFVGTDPSDGRTVTIYRGLPYDLPLGIHLYERYAGSGVTIDRSRRRAGPRSPTTSCARATTRRTS